MTTCNGRGDNGDHCCYIEGQVCQFLFTNRAGIPRCGKWDSMGDDEWQASPVGQWFARTHPGYDCTDWPQRIPSVVATAPNLCCWDNA